LAKECKPAADTNDMVSWRESGTAMTTMRERHGN
jgi:hypothetical protein